VYRGNQAQFVAADVEHKQIDDLIASHYENLFDFVDV
jgi:hypothetical protein